MDAASTGNILELIGAFFTSIDKLLGWFFYTPMLYLAVVIGVVSFLFLKKNQSFALRMTAAVFLTGAVYVFLRALHIVQDNEWLSAASLVMTVGVCIWFVTIAGKDAKTWQRIIGGVATVILVLALVYLLGRLFPEWGLTDFMESVREFFDRVFSSAKNTINP